MTAFVAKSFRQAVPYITIDEKVIQDALYWLSTKQSPSGSFPEVGAIVHKDMQGDAANGLALTAYTLIAFLENQVRITTCCSVKYSDTKTIKIMISCTVCQTE